MSTYEHVLPLIADCMSQPKFRRRLLGIHLEGPFLSPEPGAIGCHPRHLTQAPSLDTLQHLLELGRGQVKLITLAAELEGAAALAQHARQAGVVVSLGVLASSTPAVLVLALVLLLVCCLYWWHCCWLCYCRWWWWWWWWWW